MHLLCLKPDLEVLLPGHDLYLFDKDSWSCIRGLLNLLADSHFANGFADRCLVPSHSEFRFAWTLHQSTPDYPSSDNSVFHWCVWREAAEANPCLIPSGFKQLLESYASCKNLHMGDVFGIPRGMYGKDYQCFAEVTKIILVMTLATDLQFYSSICTTLSYASAECSEEVFGLPISPQHHCLRESESQIAASTILPCGSKDNFQTRVVPFSNTCTQCEKICTSSDVLPTFPLPVADVNEDDFNWMKREPVADENGEENIEDRSSYHVVQGTKPTLNTCTQCEKICTSSDVLPTFPLPVADVNEDDFNWMKREPVVDENGEENIEDRSSYHVVQGTKPTLETNVMKTLLLGNLLHIAKTYAALSSSEDSDYAFHPFPPHKVKRTRIILECPGCNIPSSCTSSSAFMKLLRHVKRRHPMDCDALLADIVERYAPLIKCMKRKIAKSKLKYPIRKKIQIEPIISPN